MEKRLLAIAAVAAAGLFVAADGAARGIPGSSYRWQQPGTAPVSYPGAQPLAVLMAVTTPDFAAGASYVWVQPGTALPQGKAPSPY